MGRLQLVESESADLMLRGRLCTKRYRRLAYSLTGHWLRRPVFARLGPSERFAIGDVAAVAFLIERRPSDAWIVAVLMANAFRALKHRNFRLFFAGQSVSLTGTWMQSVAQSWLVYRLTGSVVLLGLIGFSSQIPVFLVAPVGGVVADRYDRRRILVATQSASMAVAFVLAGLTLSGSVQVWHLFVLAVCFGVINAFDIQGNRI